MKAVEVYITLFMKIITYSGEQIETAENIWHKLERQTKNKNITNNWLWVTTWLHYFGNKVDYWFLAGFEKEKEVGIVLTTKEKYRKLPFPVASLHLGTNGEPFSDQVKMIHNKILVLKSYEEIFLKKTY